MLYMGHSVTIFEADLTTIKAEGSFRGVNSNGHALLETSTGVITIGDGRMREKKTPSAPLNVKEVMAEL